MIINLELIADIKTESYKCIDRLRSTIEHTGEIPGTLVVEKDDTYYYLLDACEQLNIELKLAEKLMVIPQIRNELKYQGR